MRNLLLGLIVILNFILQSTVLQHFSILGIIPNTSLLIIVSIAILKGKKYGSILGIIIGLIQDIIFSEVIGIHGLIYFIFGYLIGLTEEKVFKENTLIPIAFTAVATVIFHILYYIITYFLAIDVNLIYVLRRVVVVEAIYNSILVIPIYKQFVRLYREPSFSFIRR